MMTLFTIIATATIIQPTQADCISGGIVYTEGEATGTHIGLECVNSTSYDGSATTCGPNGQLISTTMQFKCPDIVPYCVQCGPRGWGAALCLSTPTTNRPGCNDNETGETNTNTAATTAVPMGEGVLLDEEFLPQDAPTISVGMFDQCDNEQDVGAWAVHLGEASLPTHLSYCSSEYNDNGCQLLDIDCIERCFVETYGYTEVCSVCFAKFPSCSVSKGCGTTCATDSFGKACEECNEPCVEELRECTGLPQIDVGDVTTCSDGREGTDDPSCTLIQREGICENHNLDEEECNGLGCCSWDPDFGLCNAACIIPDDGNACCALEDDPSPGSFCMDGRVGIDDSSCTLQMREETCEVGGSFLMGGLNESECAALGCCSWDASVGLCNAACIIPDDGNACCVLTQDPVETFSPTLKPTPNPSTLKPSQDLTSLPTQKPSPQPTGVKTSMPSPRPVDSNTDLGTGSPSANPISLSITISDSPTAFPTSNPVAPIPAPDNSRDGTNENNAACGMIIPIIASWLTAILAATIVI